MSYRNFNRHDAFKANDHAMMQFHSETIRMAQDFNINNDRSFFSEGTNMLMGIWDGFLYDELISVLKEEGYPTEVIDRTQKTIDLIEAYIKENGITYTAV